jgi:predicted enzyme related to lactoylglutathione lyase
MPRNAFIVQHKNTCFDFEKKRALNRFSINKEDLYMTTKTTTTTTMETGTFCWFDFGTKDETKTMAFYKTVLGWKFEAMGTDYWMIKAGTETIGGLRKEKKFTPAQGMTTYFTVPSVKEGRTVVTKAGGKLVGDSVAIGHDKGHFQLFTDLEGNTLALWSQKP